MNEIGKIAAGMGFLIAVYLFLSKGDETAKIITSFAKATTGGIRALQGKD